jgi:hypothetical protein
MQDLSKATLGLKQEKIKEQRKKGYEKFKEKSPERLAEIRRKASAVFYEKNKEKVQERCRERARQKRLKYLESLKNDGELPRIQ